MKKAIHKRQVIKPSTNEKKSVPSISSFPIQKDGRKAIEKWYGAGTNHIKMSPIKLMPINFDTASPSTRFPAMETTIIAKAIPVRLLMRPLERMSAKDMAEILKTVAAINVVINAQIIGIPTRANK